jgi:hypothetical protein
MTVTIPVSGVLPKAGSFPNGESQGKNVFDKSAL